MKGGRIVFAACLILLCLSYSFSAGFRYFQTVATDRMGAGTKFQMSNVGTSLPATCTTGEFYFKSNATAGQNLYGCTATNVWNILGDGGSGSAIPTGTIAYFNLGACPSGWSEYTTLRGKYAVGLVSSGTLEGGSGTALTNQESRTVGQHNHGTTESAHVHSYTIDASHSHTITDPGHHHALPNEHVVSGATSLVTTDNSATDWTVDSDSSTTGITVNSASLGMNGDVNSASTGLTVNNTGSVAGTNAPYVQLLACRAN